MSAGAPILELLGLRKHFPLRHGVFKRVVGHIRAADGIDLTIYRGETVGLVGESGCGKTTTGRLAVALTPPTSGRVRYHRDGRVFDLQELPADELKPLRRDLQIIFQDPYSSLNPRMTVRDIVAEPLEVQRIGAPLERTERVRALLDSVGLSREHLSRYAHEFSGGQRQRIGIARSLALQPRLVVCDEPVSALDVSVQAQVLNLLDELKHRLGLTYLFIAHDLSVVDHVCDRVMVMYLGKIVEHAGTDAIYRTPKHPYTEALLGAIPTGDPRSRRSRVVLGGAVPDARNVPEGCRFHPRCPYVQERCRREEPKLREVAPGHASACLFAEELRLKGFAEPCATG